MKTNKFRNNFSLARALEPNVVRPNVRAIKLDLQFLGFIPTCFVN